MGKLIITVDDLASLQIVLEQVQQLHPCCIGRPEPHQGPAEMVQYTLVEGLEVSISVGREGTPEKDEICHVL